MNELKETLISKAIVDSYHRKLLRAIESDVVIVGAGPAGLTAAFHLAARGPKVTVVEKRLAPGGGVWGGGMGMNEIVVQEKAIPILDAAGIRHERCGGGLSGIVGDGHGRLRHVRRSPDGADLRRHAAIRQESLRTGFGKGMMSASFTMPWFNMALLHAGKALRFAVQAEQ